MVGIPRRHPGTERFVDRFMEFYDSQEYRRVGSEGFYVVNSVYVKVQIFFNL